MLSKWGNLGNVKAFVNKVKVAQSCPTVCDPMDRIVHAFSRPEYWSGQLFPSPGDLPNPGIEPRSPALQVVSLPSKPPKFITVFLYLFFSTFLYKIKLIYCNYNIYYKNVGRFVN